MRRTFDGAGYPAFSTTWPGFTFPSAAGVNLSGWARPVVDGYGHGMASRSVGGVTWRALADTNPGRPSYQADLWSRWKNPGGAGRREVGLIVRAKDVRNLLVARVRSMVGGSPELRLFKVQNGTETQLGATYTGAGLSSTTQLAGQAWRVRVEDLADGTDQTRVTVYLAPTGATGKGTQVLDVTRDLSYLRGAYAVGVELTDQVFLDDVRVDDLAVFDLSDEWNPSGPAPAPGSGWQVELDGTLRSLEDLEALDPPVHLVNVKQGYGQKGNGCKLRVSGSYPLRGTSVVKPGTLVRVLEGGAVRFDGIVCDGQLEANPEEGQTWSAWDGSWRAREVFLLEDDKSGTHYFNVADSAAETWQEDRQGMSTGAVLAWLFDRYAEQLRAVGAAPATGTPYVAAELAQLTAVVPDLALAGTFPAAVETLLRLHAHRFMVFWEPADRVWHVRDVTGLTAEVLECTAEWMTFSVRPDRDRSSTCVVWMGARKDQDADLEVSLGNGGLAPAWTQEQESKYGKDKRNKKRMFAHVLTSGQGIAPDGQSRMFVTVKAGLMDTDDFRGAVLTVGGLGHTWLCTNNTGTTFWFSPPYLGGVPPIAPGSIVYASLVDKDALEHLSAAGVGRGFVLNVAYICGVGNPLASKYGAGLKLGGFCGTARAYTAGADGQTEWEEEYAYEVRQPNAFQQAAGFCDTHVVLSEPPKPSVGLVNYLPQAGSMPKDQCGAGAAPGNLPKVGVELKLPQLKPDVPYFREPAEEGTYEGDAYTAWGVTQPYLVSDPEFTDQDQEAGLRPAAKDILAVKGGKAFLASFALATPWAPGPMPPDYPIAASSARFAGLSKKVRVTSAARLADGGTGFDTTDALMVFSVTWEVEAQRTVLEAGTAAGWLEASGVDIARAYSDARTIKKVQRAMAQLAEYVNRALEKAADRIGGVQKGPVSACDVLTTNEQTRRVVSIKQDDEDKVRGITQASMRGTLAASLASGPEDVHPGNPLPVPGRDGQAAQQPLSSSSPLLGPLQDPLVPFQGPDPRKGGNLGRYGGPIVTDATLEGQPPREVSRRAGYVWRKREDAGGNPDGGPGLEVALTDAKGDADGAYVPYSSPLDLPAGGFRSLPGGLVPLDLELNHGSTGAQLLQRSRALARGLLAMEHTDTAAVVAPGGDAGGGLVAPADLTGNLLAGGMLPFRVVQSSRIDPGGLVWEGPMVEGGANAGLFWRVLPATGVLARVVSVLPATGTNLGGWVWDTSGVGGATEVLAFGEIVHKQVHLGADWETDNTRPALGGMPGAGEPGHPFLGTGHVRTFNDLAQSGWSFTVDVPDGVRGVPVFYGTVAEDPWAIMPAGFTYAFSMDWAYHASPWGGVGAGTTQAAVTTDGFGTGTGQFRQPGGAVPPGLRRVSGSVVHLPGAGTAPPFPGVFPTLAGGGVQFARTDTGWLVLFADGCQAADALGLSHLGIVEQPQAADVWHLEGTKELADALEVVDSWQAELNPPVDLLDAVQLSAAWGSSILEHGEACTLVDSFALELNP